MPDRYSKLLRNPSGVTVTPLAGDASGRRYARWSHPAFGKMIHMDARDDRPNGVSDFIKIDSHLRELGISAPEILAQSPSELLLEDLGDALFSTLLKSHPELEKETYITAADLLLRIQTGPIPPNIPILDPDVMTDAIAPVFESYLIGATGRTDPTAQADITNLLKPLLEETYPNSPRLLLRDYHSENLIWLPGRTAFARAGVLDFQDAHLGHQAYDLASLLEDTRRDVSEETRTTVLDHFITKLEVDPEIFMEGFCTQAAQRNIRILGILANLAYNHRKRRYLAFLPRVWTHLQRDFEHPSLHELRDKFNEIIPAPSPEILARLDGPDA